MLISSSTASDNLIIKAARFATLAHLGQKRKYSGKPYIDHPMRVAGRLTRLPDVTEIAVAAAWLHDVWEDCEDWIEPLKANFPQEVVDIVKELTNPSKGMLASRAVRKEFDRNHLLTASKWALVIKCMDRLDNLDEIDTRDEFFPIYLNESRLLADTLGSANTNDDWLVDISVRSLRARIKEYEDWLKQNPITKRSSTTT